MPDYIASLPACDESFSSWLQRLPVATLSQADILQTVSERQLVDLDGLGTVDPDFDLPYHFESRMRESFYLKRFNFEQFRAQALWILPHSFADYACLSCIADSLRKYERIVFHKNWRYIVAPICPIHCEILTGFRDRQRGYLQYLLPFTTPLRMNLPRHAAAEVVKIALKIQIQMLRMEKQLSAGSSSFISPLVKIYNARKLLIEFFLQAAPAGAGLATQFITTPRPKEPSLRVHGLKLLMKIGALQSNCAERACALVLMGVVTGWVTAQQIKILNEEVRSERITWGWRPIDIGRSCRQIYGHHMFSYMTQIKPALEILNNRHITLFKKGLGI